jgi:hypothetical protein
MEQPDAPAQDSADVAAPAVATESPEPINSDIGEELQEQQAPADEEEVDYEGEKFVVPKKLKDALLRQSDYTRKTQEVAAQRQAIEQERAEFQQKAQFHQEYLEELTQARAIAQQIEQFKAINWDALDEQDPAQARRLERQYRNLQEQQSDLSRRVAEKGQQKSMQEQQQAAKQLQEGAEVLRREIRDWSPEKATVLTDYAVSYGFPKEQIAKVSNPLFVKLLNDSHTLAQLRKQAVTKPKPEAQEAPVTRITASKAVANKDPDKMSMSEWTKWREAQIKRSR